MKLKIIILLLCAAIVSGLTLTLPQRSVVKNWPALNFVDYAKSCDECAIYITPIYGKTAAQSKQEFTLWADPNWVRAHECIWKWYPEQRPKTLKELKIIAERWIQL